MGFFYQLKKMDSTDNATTRAAFLPFCLPTLEEGDRRAVLDCLDSKWITTGARVATFEKMFQEKLGGGHAIAVNSATSGWQLVAHALGIGSGDEVIVPAITWVSVPNMVELLGARVVFADVCADTLQIDVGDVARKIGPQTKAIIPVHFAGAPCDLDALKTLTKDRNITLVEDAAHALGTFYKGVEIGSDAEVAIFSFHPIKNITTAEGGMIVVRDDDLAERLRLLRFHGVTKNAWNRYANKGPAEYDVVEPGYKCNMPDLLAALGISQLSRIESFNHRRSQIANQYNECLKDIPGINPLSPVPYDHGHCWHLYVVRCELNDNAFNRNELMEALKNENIGTGLHFPALHTQSYYQNKYQLSPDSCPVAHEVGGKVLSLPLFPTMTDQDVADVVRALQKIMLGKASTLKQCVQKG